ncbi:unnamed protein product [Closterium sp. Yama58-4]|nr:unnamed protein product [Closterium sp. Yama58-4]
MRIARKFLTPLGRAARFNVHALWPAIPYRTAPLKPTIRALHTSVAAKSLPPAATIAVASIAGRVIAGRRCVQLNPEINAVCHLARATPPPPPLLPATPVAVGVNSGAASGDSASGDSASGAGASAESGDAAASVERPLEGVPFLVKDLVHVAGMPTACGDERLAAQPAPPTSASAVSLLQSLGAVPIGKTNVPHLSMDFQTFNSLFGVTSNPINRSLTPGGSSGGDSSLDFKALDKASKAFIFAAHRHAPRPQDITSAHMQGSKRSARKSSYDGMEGEEATKQREEATKQQWEAEVAEARRTQEQQQAVVDSFMSENQLAAWILPVASHAPWLGGWAPMRHAGGGALGPRHPPAAPLLPH